jgi:two-component system sensor histidine kinase KdpD
MQSNQPEGDKRPSPDELLDRYGLRDQRQQAIAMDRYGLRDWQLQVIPQASSEFLMEIRRRGRVRIYLGMAAGVGKTYAMLNEGRRRKERGTDVVIGYVETHGRPLTAQQIGDLEIIPREKIEYRGVMLEEMDTDAVLARRPQVALVDELAHTNAPGSRNAKRYQDVQELLDDGITVISTLNIQHLEGLNDLVESITGERHFETIPDHFMDSADEVEMIDTTPDALRARLRHGNVYPPEQAQRALNNYFSQINLTALRALALRRMAEKTETQLEVLMLGQDDTRVPATTLEHVMVAFDASPLAGHLLRDGWRLARALRGSLMAVTIAPADWPTQRTNDTEGRAIEDYVRLAEDLGAETLRIEGQDVAEELIRIAQDRHVTQLVIGAPTDTQWHKQAYGPVVTRLLRAPLAADIHVVPRQSPGSTEK